MDSRKLAQLCRELAENKKAENLLVMDLRKLSSVTDYFVLCTGSSEPHLRAIVEEIREKLAEKGIRPTAAEGSHKTGWVVLDFFDVIVHVMRTDQRSRYDLEGLWGDAPRLRRTRTPAAPTSPPQLRRRKQPDSHLMS